MEKCRYCKEIKNKKDMEKLQFENFTTGKIEEIDWACIPVGSCRKTTKK